MGNEHWIEDAEWPLEDWKHDVSNGDTRFGYWEWVNHQRESAEETAWNKVA